MSPEAKETALVIVESPAKARTIGKYLGRGYAVEASVGHVKDLPKKDLGVDPDDGFETRWEVIRGKGKILKELRKKARKADSVILATDPDREGEAIAWHVADELGIQKDPERFRRVQFREITRAAVEKALREPARLDMHKVEAQQARRILDRLVGYKASPFLWGPIMPGLSAGRVQTVALRLICEREDEIRAFQPVEYWSITAHLAPDAEPFQAKLQTVDGGGTGPDQTATLGTEDAAASVMADLEGLPFRVAEVRRKERRRKPSPPFTTSTMQQEAAKRLRFPARMTMSTAQRLYEGADLGRRGTVGLITYMRTDSTRVSTGAAAEAQRWVRERFGPTYAPRGPVSWGGKKQKGAQEAHEAIRPTDPSIHPDEVARHLGSAEARLYRLIWLRFVASQMSPMVFDTTTVDFHLEGKETGRKYVFRSRGSVVRFPGFSKLYQDTLETGERKGMDGLDPLPDLAEGDEPEVGSLEPKQHFTQPPARFSEASLVKEMEKQGIGRPSTYAQTLSTIQDRGYVELEERRFVPTALGDTVAKLLVRVFPDLFDVEFTSRMEDELDRVEHGEVPWKTVLEDFYPGFRARLEAGKRDSDTIVKELLAAEGESCEKCGRPMMVKWNRRGRFLGCSGYPECRSVRSMDGEEMEGEGELGTHPESGTPVLLKSGPYGPYVQLGEAGEGEGKPRRSSLPDGVEPGDVTLELAVKLLSLPRVLGTDPESGDEVKAGLGRYGPYVNRAREYRSLPNLEKAFDVTLEEALELLAQRKGPAVLKELGPHPKSGEDVVILDGRYGPYVTDGKTNASLPKGAEPDSIVMEEAVKLLAARKTRGRRGGGGRKKKGGSSRGRSRKGKGS
ncbi:MAG: type I DNA topoisomerase [Gemmatimonadales bacterium]|nr:MAG: type I DNA topoisomerase [Gemmatimonadales bacterium]